MRHLRLIVWNLVLSISVMVYIGHLYCRNRRYIYLREFLEFMGVFWVVWLLIGVLWLIVHTFVDDILAEYRLDVSITRVSTFDDLSLCLQKTAQYLCWETRFLNSLNKSMTVPVQLILLVTGIVIRSTQAFDLLYPVCFRRYSNAVKIRKLREEVQNRFNVVLVEDWLYVLSTCDHDNKYDLEKFSKWLEGSSILQKE